MATSSMAQRSSIITALIVILSASYVAGTKVVQLPKPMTTEPTVHVVNPRPPPPNSQEQCVPFQHNYCSKFGYNHTISPNPWARNLTLDQAIREFNDFNELLQNNCSDKLGTFLCFAYFPLCYEQPTKGRQLVLPCKETCDYVHESACNGFILSSVGQWGSHLQCTNFRTKLETNGNCAGGHQVESMETSTTTEDSGDNGDGKKKESVTTPLVPTVATDGTKETTEENGDHCEAQTASVCSTKCTVRERSTARTFKSNHYTFAAKVTVQHKLEGAYNCKHAYQVQVLQQFNLTSRQPNSAQLTFAPVMLRESIIQTSLFNCDECPTLVPDTTYLIAGQYYTEEDGSTVWELPNGKKVSMASVWKGKNGKNYDTKLQNWIADANQYRLETKAK